MDTEHDLLSFDFQAWATTTSAGIAGLALLVAVGGLITAILSLKKASRSLALSEAQEERRTARLVCGIEKTGHWNHDGKDLDWVGLRVFLENPTDRDGTVSRAELNIKYVTDGKPITYRIDHTKPPEETKEILNIPCRLPSNGADRGWLTFPIQGDTIHYHDIVMMSLELHDTRGITEIVQTWPIKDISYDPTQ